MKKTALIFLLFGISLSALAVTYNVTVPAGTKVCYIAGEMNSWSQQQMNKVDDTHFTLDIPSATTAHRYKYCSGPSWSYVENIAQDRTYSPNDVVTSWVLLYDPDAKPEDVVYTVTVPDGTTACYFVGAPTGWVHKPMSKIGNNQFILILNTLSKDNYKYCSGPDWAFEELNASGSTSFSRNYNASDEVVSWKKLYFACPVGITYNVTVPAGTQACFLSGDMNQWGFTPMVKIAQDQFIVNVPDGYEWQTYRYYSGPGQEYVERDAQGSAVGPRAYQINDQVASWQSLYTPASTLTLTSDFSGLSFQTGTSLPIRWSSTNLQNIRIDFSGDYGATWTEISSSVVAGTGQFDWTLPAEALYQCKIKISDAANPLVTSSTLGVFVVYSPLAPKVDPLLSCYYQVFTYPYNTQYPNTNSSDSEIINGKVGNACGPTAVSNILAYWEFPRRGFDSRTFTDVKNCVWSADFSAADYNYDLVSDKLTANSPQTAIEANATLMYHAAVGMHDIYRSGKSSYVLNAFKQYFRFSSRARELNRDDYLPEQWEKIMKSELSLGRPQILSGWAALMEDGNYVGHWFMCDGYNENNEFHISLDYGEVSQYYCPLYGFKDYNLKNWIFAYLEPEKGGKNIELARPAGGENWQRGSVQEITWTSTGISQVKIEFSDNGGTTWTTLSDSTDALSGSFNLTVPMVLSTQCKIRVSDVNDINIYDRNKQPFKISDMQSVEVEGAGQLFSVSPNPACGELIIHCARELAGEAGLILMNSSGRVLYSTRLLPMETHTINTSQFPKGLYFIQLKSGQSIETQKIIFE